MFDCGSRGNRFDTYCSPNDVFISSWVLGCMISGLIIVPMISGLFLLCCDLKLKILYLKQIGLVSSLGVFLLSVKIWVCYLLEGEVKEDVNGVYFVVDGISLYFVLLTGLLIPICLLGMWKKDMVKCMGLFLILEGFVMGVFTVMDILYFYICFEGVLIPMYLIIGIWGSRARKIRAGYYLFLYTLFGSLFMLMGILILYIDVGVFDYETLYYSGISESKERILWLLFFIGFMVKIPMVPVHLWLPEAHVEAPTEGSVILAGVLLKLGSYGLIRYVIGLFMESSVFYLPMVYVLSLIGVIYTSLTAIRQTDIKRIIAYASVAHMNMTLIGLFSGAIGGYSGSILQMLSHGIVSGGLFICIGVLYDRMHTRQVYYYSGLVKKMPLFGIIFLIFTLSNIGFPGTSSFVGEFLIIEGAVESNIFVGVVSALSMVLGGCYSLWLFNRVMYGNLKEMVYKIEDISYREICMVLPLLVLALVVGVYPSICLDVFVCLLM